MSFNKYAKKSAFARMMKAAGDPTQDLSPGMLSDGEDASEQLDKIRKAGSGYESVEVNTGLRISAQNHEDLVMHIRHRLDFCDLSVRQTLIQRYAYIERAVQAVSIDGYSPLEHGQQEEQTTQPSGAREPMTIPFIMSKLQDEVTTICGILFPESGMYTALAKKEEQTVANAFATLMNKNAQKFGHFTAAYQVVTNILKYNLGGFHVSWQQVFGMNPEIQADMTTSLKEAMVFEGNKLESIDPYNILWDVGVHQVTDVATEGEFVGTVRLVTYHQLRRDVQGKRLFGNLTLEDFANPRELMDMIGGTSGWRYYREPPPVELNYDRMGRHGWDATGRPAQTVQHNWEAYINVNDPTQHGQNTIGVAEVTTVYMWINGDEFGLGGVKGQYNIWKFKLLNGRKVILAELQQNTHGALPIHLMQLDTLDSVGYDEKSQAQFLMPFQQHIQDLLNKHQATTKKGLIGGITLYNQRHVNLDTAAMPLSGFIPVNPQNSDADIRASVMQLNQPPDTSQTLEQIKALVDLMENLMPTKQLSQVADLQRATRFQAAATVASSNKKELMKAKRIDEKLMAPTRNAQLYNIYANQKTTTVVGPDGKEYEVDVGTFAKAGIEYSIADGLLGIDRMIYLDAFWQIIQLIIQSNLGQQFDLAGMIDAYTNALGDRTDFRSYQIQHPMDGLPPDAKDAAMQLLQQMQGGQGGLASVGQQQAQNQTLGQGASPNGIAGAPPNASPMPPTAPSQSPPGMPGANPMPPQPIPGTLQDATHQAIMGQRMQNAQRQMAMLQQLQQAAQAGGSPAAGPASPPIPTAGGQPGAPIGVSNPLAQAHSQLTTVPAPKASGSRPNQPKRGKRS